MRPHLRLAAVLLSLGLLTAAGAAGFSQSSSSDVYTVQPGDSLWAISQRTGVSVATLAADNGMNQNDILPIGKQLYIPTVQTTSEETSSSSSGSGGSSSTYGNSNPTTFCSTFTSSGGSYGVLPSLLSESPSRLALQPIMQQWASHYGLSLPLLEAIDWQESGWQQGVVSVTGAVGVGQIEPYTATFVSQDLVGESLDINSVSDNIRMSAALLAYLADTEGNSVCNTIAAYYEGTINLSQYGVFPSAQVYVADVEALIPNFE